MAEGVAVGPVHAAGVGRACRGELSGLLTAVVRARRRAMSMLAGK
ncbi:hypothetical protein OG949_42015 (plasmid) [Streptomyces scopuliridis]|nr:hypothetical protein [Streptomyces scopuliridis]WSB39310.1 hypothetical protein OG949_42015 [Streptomyces scopuliridis]